MGFTCHTESKQIEGDTHNELLAPVGSLLPSTYNKNLIESLVHEGYHHVNACIGKWSSYKQRQLTAIILILT